MPATPYGPMRRAVEQTIDACALPATDVALGELCRAWADEIDVAEERSDRLDRVLSRLSRQRDPDMFEALVAARGLLSARATLDRLGGRLASGLTSLRATPASRPVEPPAAPKGSRLGQLRSIATGPDS